MSRDICKVIQEIKRIVPVEEILIQIDMDTLLGQFYGRHDPRLRQEQWKRLDDCLNGHVEEITKPWHREVLELLQDKRKVQE